MGGLDIERKGSMSSSSSSQRRKINGSSREVHPIQESGVPVYIPPKKNRRISFVIPLIVIVNVVMFILTMYINNCPKNNPTDTCLAKFLGRFSFQPFSENPLLGPSSHALLQLGALDSAKVVHDNQGWRLITCIWLHAGVFHILANMLSLLFIGIKLEQEFGLLKVGALYLVSGFGGSLLSALFLQSRISVGASGAVFGLMGGLLSELITNWTIYSNKCGALITLVLVVVLNLAVGILPYVDNFAHIGGFIVGFLVGFVLLLRPQFGWVNRAYIPTGYEVQSPTQKHKLYQYILFLVSLLILIVSFVVAIILVFKGVDGNEKCSWCHYLDCVPSSKWNCNNVNTTCITEITGDNLLMTCLTNNHTSSTTATQSDSYLESLCTQLCT